MDSGGVDRTQPHAAIKSGQGHPLPSGQVAALSHALSQVQADQTNRLQHQGVDNRHGELIGIYLYCVSERINAC